MKKICALLILCLFLFTCAGMSAPALATPEKETAFERVMRTKTLRCAYTIYPTFVERDPNTGAFSGLFYDLVNEMGRQLNIKVEWVAEVGTDVIFEGFKNNSYDAVCPGYFATPSRAWGGDFTKPLVFIPFNVYVRAGDTRFHTFSDLNNPAVKIATMDGEMSQIATNESFPKAQQVTLGGLSAASERLEMLASGKVDATPMEAGIGLEYIEHNPDKIAQLGSVPLRLGGSVVIIPHNEFALKNLLDTAIDTMLWTGSLERIVQQHVKYPGSILLPAAPYQHP